MLFNIQRYSIHDGPGIRTTVFLKGCNLKCFWCHNAESRKSHKQVQFFEQKCKLCGRCVEVCRQNAHKILGGEKVYERDSCITCGRCVKECANGALVMSGYAKDVCDVIKEVKKDAPFYKSSGGGVTISGGEPMLQIDFLKSILIECKNEHIHTALDTAGCVAWEDFEKIIPYTDLFLFDIKTMNAKKHIMATGSGNELILSNLKKLDAAGADIIIRVPVIPGFNDTNKDILEIADFVNRLQNIKKVDILPYNEMAGAKFESLGLMPPDKNKKKQSDGEITNYKKYFLANETQKLR